jgi:uncharacterized protein YdhG (YjbR/CyaY superfamily)
VKRGSHPEAAPVTVDEYIARCAPEARPKLEALRAAIRELAPEAEEKIAYGMPAYSLNGPLVYYAAHKGHIGLYPLPEAIEEFRERLAPYKTAKGSVQFPLEAELPLELIRDMLRSRLKAKAVQTAPKGGSATR